MNIDSKLLAAAAEAIQTAHSNHPELTRNGWTTPNPAHGRVFPPTAVATAIAFLRDGPVVRLKRPSKLSNSYHLKHVCEEWGREHNMESYVATGDLLVAALYLGIPLSKPFGPNSDCGVRCTSEDFGRFKRGYFTGSHA